jgi:hypothetical protein
VLKRTCLPGDIIAVVVFGRRHFRLILRDRIELMALRRTGNQS